MQVGDKAPAIKLYGTDKKQVDLQEVKGNKLLLFFPLAFTSTCTAELCSIRDDISKYNDFNTSVFGISVDSLYALARYKEEQNLNFPLLSDFNKEATLAFGVLDDTFPFDIKGISKRSAFVIDADGIISYMEICPTPGDLPDFEKIKLSLEQLNK